MKKAVTLGGKQMERQKQASLYHDLHFQMAIYSKNIYVNTVYSVSNTSYVGQLSYDDAGSMLSL
jgi:hypothetical protein